MIIYFKLNGVFIKRRLLIIFEIFLFIIVIFIVINGINKKLNINNFKKIQGIFNYNEEENIYYFNSQDIKIKSFETQTLYHLARKWDGK